MNAFDQILQNYPDEQFMYPTGFEEAIIGLEPSSMRLVIDEEKVIAILMEDGMELEDAVDYYHHNIECAYIGKQTPIYIQHYNEIK